MPTEPNCDTLPELVDAFRAAGGVMDNLTVRHTPDRGFCCFVTDPASEARVFCPQHLLVRVEHIGIDETGLKITERAAYGAHIDLLDRYFSLHFGRHLVEAFLAEKAQIDALTERERKLLSVISLPEIDEGIVTDLDYARARILASHYLGSKHLGGRVVMPFVTFLNHDRDGQPFVESGQGIGLSGRFAGEAYACYHHDDSLAMLRDHGIGAASRFSYSLPMIINLPGGRQLRIKREHKASTTTPEGHPWPLLETSDTLITLSWFPLYFRHGPRFPARVARYLAETCNLPGELVMHAVYSYNFGQLFHLSSALRHSENPYVQRLVAGLDIHIQQCTGVFPDAS